MPKFSHHFVRFQCDLQKKKKKKKGHRAKTGIFFSDFMLISEKKKKKKVLRLSSATFLRDLCDIPERDAVNRRCLRFLAGNKNAGFWREKKRRNSQNFSEKMPEKISHFFELTGSTALSLSFRLLLVTVMSVIAEKDIYNVTKEVCA